MQVQKIIVIIITTLFYNNIYDIVILMEKLTGKILIRIMGIYTDDDNYNEIEFATSPQFTFHVERRSVQENTTL